MRPNLLKDMTKVIHAINKVSGVCTCITYKDEVSKALQDLNLSYLSYLPLYYLIWSYLISSEYVCIMSQDEFSKAYNYTYLILSHFPLILSDDDDGDGGDNL